MQRMRSKWYGSFDSFLCMLLIINGIGHPTCMDLGAIGDILRSYEWKCIECKTCELCSEKGDDVRPLSPCVLQHIFTLYS